MTVRTLALASAALLMAGCVTTPRANEDGSRDARLGQTIELGGPRVTPLRVLEDSRCPMEARCVWAGRVRLQVRIETGGQGRLAELDSSTPLSVADGSLQLVSVMPPRSTQRAIAPADYRFSLKFSGGL